MKKKKGISIQEEYIRDWNHWLKIYLYGCQDPNWSDGVNLNLVRNHLLNDVRQGAVPPEEMPVPEIVSSLYMARREAILEEMEETYAEFMRSDVVLELLSSTPIRSQKEMEAKRKQLIARVHYLKSCLESESELHHFRRIGESKAEFIERVEKLMQEMKRCDRSGEQLSFLD